MNNELDTEQFEHIPESEPTSDTAPDGTQQQGAKPQAPYYSFKDTVQPQKVRRVGTLTMGLALIATGVVAIAVLFNPSLDVITIAKLAPVVLIFLGIEILINHFFHRGDKLKYDFLSGFVCFVLICASVSAIIIPPLYEQYGPHRYESGYRIGSEIETMCFQALSGTPVSSLSARVHLEGPLNSKQELTYQDLRPMDYVELDIQLMGSYTDKAQFAQDCKKVLEKLTAAGIPFRNIRFRYSADEGVQYYLNIDDKFEAALDAEKLAQLVGDNTEELAWESTQAQLETESEEMNSELEQQRAELEQQREELAAERQAFEEQQANAA
ncbi:hypothetical protein [Hydrogenoanaerobacterium sp.]|uniref:hypothetical protein n=1 Tax=Hydrogenoanaerobacterium sp. TaxID=2953763 RepID=UPI00289EB26C|nr:hypothetical protein [Hydrogenoanaerobacterium sp.]